MAQGCLKCLKLTMCAANFLCFICGMAVLSLGIHLMINFQITALTPTLAKFSVPNILLVCGIVITCLSFLGFMGALKENRCLLLTFFLLLFALMLLELMAACLLLVYDDKIANLVKQELQEGLVKEKSLDRNATASTTVSNWDLLQSNLKCCGVDNATEWGNNIPKSCPSRPLPDLQGCFKALKNLYEEKLLTLGIAVITLCIVEVLGMCFAMTLFCHIRSGIGYKL